jgi:hypothetical protein
VIGEHLFHEFPSRCRCRLVLGRVPRQRTAHSARSSGETLAKPTELRAPSGGALT